MDVMSITGEGQRALATLYRQEADGVFSYLLFRCGSRSLAEDLTADTFIAAHALCTDGRQNEVTPGWLRTVAKRRLVDYWRRTTVQKRGFDALRVLARGRHSSGAEFTEDRVAEALDSLADRQRAALVLRYLDGFSVSEVSDIMNQSYKSTESLLSRARKSFEKSFKEVR